ncbi:hypothetical protein AAFF_G00373590 [Aldrovandia affinis]|uniref:TATA box-binding protein-associated factor RNA polymerase I subunit C n=1 Tax=Aldrovandia affinis TaxID=143900 RepID=A0AAD7SGI4_9TELE|nr:hypothetical protein AAFF_G00373590 [Aldrovandia affinis]
MDGTKFPRQLFPSFYNTGPPKAKSVTDVGGWGLYGQAFEINHCLSEKGPGQLADWKFDTQHKVKGETWKPFEPIPAPLLAPSKVPIHMIASGRLPSALDFPEHMQHFYLDNSEDAFSTMSSLLGEHFNLGERSQHRFAKENTISMSRMKHFLSIVNYRKCPVTYYGKRARRYNHLFDDVIHDIPPVLLADLLHEELVFQRDRAQFNEVATGGALGYFPLKVTDNFQEGCLVFPREASFSSLTFHKVVLEFGEDKAPKFSMRKTQPLTMKLNGPVRQISVGSMQENVYVGVRSDYHCGVWQACPTKRLKPLEVIQTKQMATCINVSPHIAGEVLVASENGAAYLWTVGKGLSKFREEEGNLYFNAHSSWRWCDFSAHPKVMQYADRTGVELTDTRSSDKFSYTLFRIGETPNCKSGERVVFSKYLSDSRAYHHLITTQHSVYIMDERFSCLPMLKWEHMMVDPPLFAQVVAGSSQARSNKVLLGSQRSQELMLLQYSGGGEAACHSVGPPSKLSRPTESLSHLPVHIPHRLQQVEERLGVPTAGVIAIHHSKAEECMCVLQLSEAGDIFYQILRPQTNQDGVDTPQPRNRTAANAEHSVATTQSKTRCEVEVVINGDEEEATASNTEIHSRAECSVTLTPAPLSEQTGSSVKKDLTSPKIASKDILSRWERWLTALFNRSEPPSNSILSHWTVGTKDLFSCKDSRRDPLEDDQLQSLRKDLRDAMKRKDVLVHGITYLRHLEVAPLPDPVVPAEWGDDLSQRLSASWEGQWKSWWEDKLGTNREQKVEALRRKRRQQKQARAHRRVGLSESFVSSTSYQSDLDNLSGLSSATSTYMDSQGTWSDASNVTKNPSIPNTVPGPERAVTLESGTQVLPLATVEVVDSPSASLRLMAPGEMKRPEQDYLSSLFGSEEPQEVGEDGGLPLMLAPSSQVSNIASSQRDPRVVPSSQGSLFSQPRRKRPRMGF